MQDNQKCAGGKCDTGIFGTKTQGWKKLWCHIFQSCIFLSRIFVPVLLTSITPQLVGICRREVMGQWGPIHLVWL